MELPAEDARRVFLARASDDKRPRVVLINYRARNKLGNLDAYIYTGGPDGYVPERRIEVAAWGADAVIVQGGEAGGHTGSVPTTVLLPQVVDDVDIPVIAAGGFFDGRGLVAALAYGAAGIAMGTRFMSCKESPVHERQKAIATEKDIHDTVYTERVDGLPARFLRTFGATRMMKQHINPATALISSRRIAKLLDMPWAKIFAGIVLAGPAKATRLHSFVT